MGKFQDLSGQKFGMLTVLRLARRLEDRSRTWWCLCDCGTEKELRSCHFKYGKTISCGCIQKGEDLTGKRFGKLTVIVGYETEVFGVKYWKCVCECGEGKICQGSHLKSGQTVSCGCIHHRMSYTKIYSVWSSMKDRCYNENSTAYKNYGGKGVKVCYEWVNEESGFLSFYKDMGEAPEGMSLDRIDVTGDYCPENCRWADRSTQNFNQRKRITNTSGVVGVSWSKSANKWFAHISKNNSRTVLGYFEDFDEACKVRWDAEIEYYGVNRND